MLVFVFTDVEHLHWVQTLKDAHMVIDASLQWVCKAMGQPIPTYKWLKNGQPLLAEVRQHKKLNISIELNTGQL